MKMEGFAELIPERLQGEQGRAFYSGRSAFENPSPLYILGFNPAGSWKGTVFEHTTWVLRNSPDDWSAYEEEGGQSNFRPVMLHLFKKLGRSSGALPASNLIFKSSRSVRELENRYELADACWPFHSLVIEKLGVKVVTLTHPSRFDWRNPASDPTHLVVKAIRGDYD